MTALDLAMNKLRPSLVADAITVMRPTGMSLYVHGAPGIAKSAVARQVADKLGIAFIDLRLSQMAPEDLRGVPMLGEIDGMKGVLWSPPLVFPRDLDYQKTELVDGSATIRYFNPLGNNGIRYCTEKLITVTVEPASLQATITTSGADRFTVVVQDTDHQPAKGMVTWTVSGPAAAILALEEFNSAPPSVMAASYQLVLDRRLGDYLVPDGVMLLAMGNRDGDKGVTFKLPLPVANRFVHLEMVVHFEDWLDWAVQHRVHPDVVGYLSRWPSKLLDFNPNAPTHSFATPRSWEFASRVISQSSASVETTRALICGAIGTAIGTEFLLHREFMAEMPNPQSILDGKTTLFHVKNKAHVTQIAYSTVVQMLYLLKQQNDDIKQKYPSKLAEDRSPERKRWREAADRAIGYMIDHFAPEVSVVGMRMAMLNHGLRFTSDMPRCSEFHKLHRDLFFEGDNS